MSKRTSLVRPATNKVVGKNTKTNEFVIFQRAGEGPEDRPFPKGYDLVGVCTPRRSASIRELIANKQLVLVAGMESWARVDIKDHARSKGHATSR